MIAEGSQTSRSNWNHAEELSIYRRHIIGRKRELLGQSRLASLVSVAKGKIVRWNRGFWLFFSASFACHLMWGLTHLCDDSRQDRISCRYHSLDGERGGRAVAGVSWFAEFSPQSVHAGELPGVFVRRAASQPRSLRPAQRTPVCGLRSRRPCGFGLEDGA